MGITDSGQSLSQSGQIKSITKRRSRPTSTRSLKDQEYLLLLRVNLGPSCYLWARACVTLLASDAFVPDTRLLHQDIEGARYIC